MRKGSFWLSLLLLLSSALSAKTVISSNTTLNADAVWSAEGSPYVLQGDLTLAAGKTLTIKGGVTVLIADQRQLNILGTLKADSATFTSLRDTVGGAPTANSWRNLNIFSDGKLELNFCQLRYAGYNEGYGLYFKESSKQSSLLKNSQILKSRNGVYLATKSRLVLENSAISNTGWPLVYAGNALVEYRGLNSFSGNLNNGIYISHSATGGSALHLPAAPGPYFFNNSFTVASNDSLLAYSGAVLKFNQYQTLVVNGYLQAVANEGEYVGFTAYTDDNSGGDTNNDGITTSPKVGYWSGVLFNKEAKNSSLMQRCKVSYAGYNSNGGITFDGASPTVSQSEMNNCFYGLKCVNAAAPALLNNLVVNSQVVPVAISFDSSPSFKDNDLSLTGNQFHAIGLLGGTLVADAVVPKRSSKNIENMTYVLLSQVVVPQGRTLTIKKGVVIKSGLDPYNYYYGYNVSGKVVAEGSVDSAVVFTSIKDDNYGNPKDTNHDGTQTFPAKNDWQGFWFSDTADDSSILSYCKVRFAGRKRDYYYNVGNPSQAYFQLYSAIMVDRASITLRKVELTDMDNGLAIYNTSKMRVENCDFTNSSRPAIAISVSADPVLSGITLLNTPKSLGVIGEAVGFDGLLKKRDLAGYSNITYQLLGHLAINPGTRLSVEKGVVVKAQDNGIFLRGLFDAVGSSEEKVIFTSLMDDNYGNPGDTNGDGNATVPAINQWDGLFFRSTMVSENSLLQQAIVKFATNGVAYESASVKVSDCEVWNCAYAFKIDGNSTPLLERVKIYNSTNPVGVSLLADPQFKEVQFSGCAINGLKVIDVTLAANARMKKKSLAGFENIAYVFDDFTIAPNAILSVDPGIVMKMTPNYRSRSWTINGGIKVNGTAKERVVITSMRDDSAGGDTNNDGNSTTPDMNDWRTIVINGSALDSASYLRNCQVRYASGTNSWDSDFNDAGAMRLYNSRLRIDSCEFSSIINYALSIYGESAPVVSNTIFNTISMAPIRMSMFATPTFSNNQAYNVGYLALGIKGETWSKDAIVPKRDFSGYKNISYLFDYRSPCTINSGTTITIPEGVVFKSSNSCLIVNGGLKVLGSKSEPVVFSVPEDDAYGSPADMQQNGSFTKPSTTSNSYNSITFNNQAADADCLVKNTVFRYHDYGMILEQASPAINNALFEYNNHGVLLNGVSNPLLDSTTFNNLVNSPLVLSLTSYPASSKDNRISGKTWRGLEILDNETLSQDITLSKRDFGGIKNIPYILRNYTVGSGATLTIKPGVVLKFLNYGSLVVRKGLLAEGGKTPDSLIVFTSLTNDFYGNDTNADSAASASFALQWRFINFAPESNDPLCRLKNCVVSGADKALYIQNASPTVKSCTLSDNNYALYLEGASNPLVANSSIFKNSQYGIFNKDRSFNIEATQNWWGQDNGPQHSSNPQGTGDKLSDGVKFIPFATQGSLNPVLGDVSLNGEVAAYDASLILKHLVGSVTLNELQQMVADVSANKGVTAYDASLILQKVVGRIGCFPQEGALLATLPKSRELLKAQSLVSGKGELSSSTNGDLATLTLKVKELKNIHSGQLRLKIAAGWELVMVKNLHAELSLESVQKEQELLLVLACAQPLPEQGDLVQLELKRVSGQNLFQANLVSFLANETELLPALSLEQERKLNYSLEQNYPNPFNPSTTISYTLAAPEMVKLAVYNLRGELVQELVNEPQGAGSYRVNFDGSKLSAGVYIYRLQSKGLNQSRRLLLLK